MRKKYPLVISLLSLNLRGFPGNKITVGCFGIFSVKTTVDVYQILYRFSYNAYELNSITTQFGIDPKNYFNELIEIGNEARRGHNRKDLSIALRESILHPFELGNSKMLSLNFKPIITKEGTLKRVLVKEVPPYESNYISTSDFGSKTWL